MGKIACIDLHLLIILKSGQRKIITDMFGLGGAATGMFNQLVEQCHSKCINKSYNDSDVSKQEALCLDRCVSKYFETNVQVGEHMQKMGQSGQFMGRQ